MGKGVRGGSKEMGRGREEEKGEGEGSGKEEEEEGERQGHIRRSEGEMTVSTCPGCKVFGCICIFMKFSPPVLTVGAGGFHWCSVLQCTKG